MHHSLEIQGLAYSYPDGRPALRGIDLLIQPGEKVALVGPNGAGKSTLLLHLNGLLSGRGVIRVCGIELNRSTQARVRSLVGLVFQNPDDQLFSPTVYEDVAFGPIHQGLPQQDVRERADAALAAVGLEGFGPRSPYRLSVGEKKRAAIASVLSMRPEVLALDEPSAGLDPRSRRGLTNLLRDLPATMLIATHDLPLALDLTPRTVLMDGGVIVADGPTETILADEALLAAHGLERP